MADIRKDEKVVASTISVSSAQILSMHSTPITLIAAPGANKIMLVDECVLSLTAGTQYAGGQTTTVRYESTSISTLTNDFTAAHINSATNLIRITKGVGNIDISTCVNKALTWSQTSVPTAFTTGTGTIKFFIKYRIITL